MIQLRWFVALLAVAAAALVFAPRVSAQSHVPNNINIPAETEAVRDLLQQAMRAYRLGNFDAAYKFSRAAYLDRFENIEAPLRLIDSNLTLDMEFRFADLRSLMQAGAPAGNVEQSVRSIRSGLDEIDAMFASVGVLAPSLAFFASFTIIFREGLEAVLVVSTLLVYLRGLGGVGRQGRRYVAGGIGLALVGTLATWLLLRFVLSIVPVGREIIEASVALIATVMLFWVSFWLVNRLDRRRWMEFLQARASATVAGGGALGLLGLGFTAVYREGFETVLFYEVLLGLSSRSEWFVLAGFVAGSVALAVVAWVMLRTGRRLPVRRYMQIAVTIVMLLSVAFIGQTVRAFQETGLLNVTSLIGTVPRLPRSLADLTGFYPTVETIFAQFALAAVYIGGALYLWWRNRASAVMQSQEAR